MGQRDGRLRFFLTKQGGGLLPLLVGIAAALSACNRDAEPSDAPVGAQRMALTCGDGDFDENEECDKGTSDSLACSEGCEVLNMLVEAPGIRRVERYTGTSRHPSAVSSAGFGISFLEIPEPLAPEDPTLETKEPVAFVRAQLFTRVGERTEDVVLNGDLLPWDGTSAAMVGLDDGSFATVFEAFDADGDELGLALRGFGPDGTLGPLVVANEVAVADQVAPDVVKAGGGIVVAWTDHSNAVTGPDIRFRRFGQDLSPVSDDETLAATDAFETSVALTRWGDSWAAAFRAAQPDGTEDLVIVAPDLDLEWKVSGYWPAASDDRPSLVALDDATLLVAFAEGTIPDGHFLPDVSRLRIAVLHEGNAGEVDTCDPVPDMGTYFEPQVSQGQPTLATLDGEVALGWRSALVPGDARSEELWETLRPFSAGIESCSELGGGGISEVPTGEAELVGDQRHLAFVAERGLRVATWEDYARTISSDQGSPDLVLKLSPYRTDCSVEEPCAEGEGHCSNDEECEPGLKCGHRNGEAFGYPPNFNVCIPCGDGVVDPGEECDDGMQSPVCNGNCTISECGDGFHNTADGEHCDNGTPGQDSEGCNANCTLVACGDGYTNSVTEECEPEIELVSDAECDLDCTLPQCGDGVLNPAAGEQCELTTPGCGLDCGIGTCPSGGCLRVESKLAAVLPYDFEMHPHIRLTNLSEQTLDLSEYSIRYWFYYPFVSTYDLDVVWDPAYVQEGTMAVFPLAPEREAANNYVHIPLEGTLGPDGAQLPIEFSFRHDNTSLTFIEDNDYSYLQTLTYLENTHITVYHNGTLVWGEEPEVLAQCGDGTVGGDEQCDDAGESATCDADCTEAECGDGLVNESALEVCDPGLEPDCLSDCTGYMQCTDPGECLHVLYNHYSDDTRTNQQIKMAFRLVNNSSEAIALSRITLRYWFTKEPTGSLVTACDYTQLQGGCSAVVHQSDSGPVAPLRQGADYFWEVGFTSAAGTLNGNTTLQEVLVHAQNEPWTNLNENNDYSYIDTITPMITQTVTLYVDGELVWGIEPPLTDEECGDGTAEGFEQCDDAGQSPACDADCTDAECGDGTVNGSAGELCDPGSDPGCRLDCQGPLLCTNSATCLHVKHRTHGSDTSGNQYIKPALNLVNNGASSIPMSAIKLRYWFTKEPTGTFSTTCETTTSTGGCAAITGSSTGLTPPLSGADRYWEVGFTSAAGSLAAASSSGEFRLRGQTNPLVNFTETNDYSYVNTTTSTVTTKVTVYVNGVLVWGQEPPPVPPVCPNGIAESGEECDTGGQSATCDADCTNVVCGDGTVNSAASEVCDPGANPQCNSTCTGYNSCTNSAACLHVRYKHDTGESPTDDSVKPRYQVVNSGTTTVQLSQLKIRYWFTKEPSGNLQFWCDYATLGCSNIVTNAASGAWSPVTSTANYYWDVGFTSGTLAPGANTGEIVMRTHADNWAAFNENNDFSYANWTTYTPRTQVGLYLNGTLVWGVAP
jgi:hypothetical protein